MADHISVSSHHSYGSRVGNSLTSILFGIVLVIGSIVGLVWNEKNFIQQKKGLEEGASIVQETVASEINSGLDQMEVHVTGETSSKDSKLVDDDFGVTVDDLKLLRTVEMYQRYEESDTECSDNYGGSEDCTTTYDYYKKWSDSQIDSNRFYETANHENPSSREYQSNEKIKSPINLGVYTLSDVFVNKLTNYRAVNLSEQDIITPQKYINNPGNFHKRSDYIYIGTNPDSPTIGDLRIKFSSVQTGIISIVGKQSGNELRNYIVKNGVNIALLQQGSVSAEDMFITAQKENKNITRIIRGIGLLLMFCGFASILKFIETIAKVIPFLSKIIGVGTGLIALLLTLVVGFVTIGLAWIAVRPIIGISCLVVAIIGIFLLKKGKKDKEEPTQPSEKNELESPEKPEAEKLEKPENN